MYDLTGFQRDLLYVIAGLDDPHGLAIKYELEEYYKKRFSMVGSIQISTHLLRKDSSRRANTINGPMNILPLVEAPENSRHELNGRLSTSTTVPE